MEILFVHFKLLYAHGTIETLASSSSSSEIFSCAWTTSRGCSRSSSSFCPHERKKLKWWAFSVGEGYPPGGRERERETAVCSEIIDSPRTMGMMMNEWSVESSLLTTGPREERRGRLGSARAAWRCRGRRRGGGGGGPARVGPSIALTQGIWIEGLLPAAGSVRLARLGPAFVSIDRWVERREGATEELESGARRWSWRGLGERRCRRRAEDEGFFFTSSFHSLPLLSPPPQISRGLPPFRRLSSFPGAWASSILLISRPSVRPSSPLGSLLDPPTSLPL